MSRENVEVVRRFYEHFNRAGEPPWELFDHQAEFDATAVVGFGVMRGSEQIRAAIREYAAAFESWQIEPEEFLEAGDQVVTIVRDGGRLRGSGDELYNRFVHVWTLRSGKVVRWKTFTDRAEALEAAGLSE